MSEIVVKDLRPINELITIFQNQVLVVKGLPYSGKSTGIRNATQEPMQAILQIDDLKKFLTEKRTSRTHLELPKDLTDHNIKEWKSCLRNLSQSNKNVIIEGRSYVVECLLGDEQLLHINQEKNIVTQIFSHLLTLTRTYVEGFQTYIFRLSRDDAKNYLDYFGLNSGYHNDILEYSSITIGKEQSHLALL
jgi:hypothetical protein